MKERTRIEKCAVSTVNLNNYGTFDDAEISDIVTRINAKTNITSVQLNRNSLNDKKIIYLSQHFTNVVEISLDQNNCTDIGAVSLISCKKFKSISLQGNKSLKNKDDAILNAVLASDECISLKLAGTYVPDEVLDSIDAHCEINKKRISVNSTCRINLTLAQQSQDNNTVSSNESNVLETPPLHIQSRTSSHVSLNNSSSQFSSTASTPPISQTPPSGSPKRTPSV